MATETKTDRKMIDCSWFSEAPDSCTLQITGRESEVLDAAVAHAVASHGHSDNAELRQQLAGAMRNV
jgi:hypothetical protein